MFKNNIKIAWRNIIKDKQFTLLNLVGLSTGLACVLLIYLWVTDELQVGRFNQNNDRLLQVMINAHTPDGIQTGDNTPGLLASSLKQEMPEVEYAVSAIHPGGLTSDKGIFTLGNKQVEATDLFAGKDYFNVFPYNLVQGNRSEMLVQKNAIVISDELAIKLFNTTQNIIGKFIEWNQYGLSGLYTISGIFKKPPPTVLDRFDVVFNYDLFLGNNPKLTSWTNNDPYTYVLLKKGTDVERFNNKISNFLKTKQADTKTTLYAQKYADKYLHGHYENGVAVGGRIEYVKLFSIIAIFILVIACINFMNLSTAKASRRLKEAGVKKVMGAPRLMLVAQYMGESMMMAFLALAVAIVLVLLLLPEFNQLAGKQLTPHFDSTLIIAVILITVFTGLISGSYPAFYISGFKPIAVLKSGFNGGAGNSFARKGLVVFQFTLSVIFIVSVAVIYQQMQLVETKNLGYNRDNIIYFEKGGLVSDNKDDYAPGGKYEKDLENMLLNIRNIPGVVNDANFRHNITNRHGGTSDISWAGKSPNSDVSFTDIAAGYGFIETLGIQMKEGRPFSMKYADEKSKIILNEAAVEAMGLKNPLGKIIKVWGDNKEIIGVTKNFNFESLYESLKPCFFDFTFNNRASKIMVKIKAGTEKETISKIEEAYHQLNPGLPFNYTFLDDDYQALYASEKRIAALSKYFAGMAIIISCLGLFGLAAFTAQKRQKEIGIRKVIGANVSGLAFMLSKDFLKLILISIGVAFPVAWWFAHQWLQGFACRVDIGAGIFIATGAFTIFITLLTISYQAIKAAIENPIIALKTE